MHHHKALQSVLIALIILVVFLISFNLITNSYKAKYDDTLWKEAFKKQINVMKQGNCSLLLAGDSITMWFETTAPDEWNRYVAPHHPLNFGIAGDTTVDLLYRLNRAPLHKISPKICTVLIGVNDLIQGDPPEQIRVRIMDIATLLSSRYPESRVVVFRIFPAEKYPGEIRQAIDMTNKLLASTDFPENVSLMPALPGFVDENGVLTGAILLDQLHLSPTGYEIWGREIDQVMGFC